MADHPPVAEGEEGVATNKKKKMMIIIGAVVLLAGGGGGGWFFMNKSKPADGHGPEHVEAPKVQPVKPPVFVNMDAFTVNLASEQGEQFLQMVAVLKVADEQTSATIKSFMPEIRHRYLMLLSGKKPSEIASQQGRDDLSAQMRSIANQVILAAQGRLAQVPVSPPPPVAAAPAPAEAAPVKVADHGGHADGAKPASDGAHGPAAADPHGAAPQAGTAPRPPVAVPTATLVYAPRADDPIQSVFFTSFIIQ